MIGQAINLLWFKRDLRVYDHEPLQKAIETGLPVLSFYAFEPQIMAYPDWDIRHGRFVYQSILDLTKRYPNLRILVLHGEMEAILTCFTQNFKVKNLFSHQETGTKASFERDKKVAAFCRQNRILWQETPSNGVLRGAKNRLNWDKQWKSRMYAPIVYPDIAALQSPEFNPPSALQLPPALLASLSTPNPLMQSGGESAAIKNLSDFLSSRYKAYNRGISKPAMAESTCSRLSPYLAWGNLSLRQVIQSVEKKRRSDPHLSEKPLQSFVSRLHWHCHFIQKFERECRMEFENVNRGYDLLEKQPDQKRLHAWETGQTGFPLVDACMRCVQTTGFLNFRMRAMLVSFLTHHLWQPWQAGVYHLSRFFLDYEPGIHFPQFHMQAGVTGINIIRIYNPVRNAILHDAQGEFIKKWVPELAALPLPFVFEPYKMTALEQQLYKVRLGDDYPKPVVNLAQTQKFASDSMWAHRNHPAVLEENERILNWHTFRKTRDDNAVVNFGEEDDENE